MKARAVLLVSLLVICTGCLPTRDNRSDPQIAPDVRVRVIELTHDGHCPADTSGARAAAAAHTSGVSG